MFGILLSYSPTTYKIPNIQDIPDIFRVDYLQNPHHQINIRRSKAIGEPPLMLCLSVWMAVKHALSCVKPGALPKLRLPATGEEILRCLTELTDEATFSTPDQEILLIAPPSLPENQKVAA
jgi:xanthine dehydrogenase large subunit